MEGQHEENTRRIRDAPLLTCSCASILGVLGSVKGSARLMRAYAFSLLLVMVSAHKNESLSLSPLLLS